MDESRRPNAARATKTGDAASGTRSGDGRGTGSGSNRGERAKVSYRVWRHRRPRTGTGTGTGTGSNRGGNKGTGSNRGGNKGTGTGGGTRDRLEARDWHGRQQGHRYRWEHRDRLEARDCTGGNKGTGTGGRHDRLEARDWQGREEWHRSGNREQFQYRCWDRSEPAVRRPPGKSVTLGATRQGAQGMIRTSNNPRPQVRWYRRPRWLDLLWFRSCSHSVRRELRPTSSVFILRWWRQHLPLRPRTLVTVVSRQRECRHPQDWAGYAVTGATFTNVAGSWIQPTATCPKNQLQEAAFWVGIDGYSSSDPTVQQVGTDSDCTKEKGKTGGGPDYYAWYQLYPESDVVLSSSTYPVTPGDAITASVSVSGSVYTLAISDGSKWHFTTSQTPETQPENLGSNGSPRRLAQGPSARFSHWQLWIDRLHRCVCQSPGHLVLGIHRQPDRHDEQER